MVGAGSALPGLGCRDQLLPSGSRQPIRPDMTDQAVSSLGGVSAADFAVPDRRIDPHRPSLLLALALAVGASDLACLLTIDAALALALRAIDQAGGGACGTFHGHSILKLELTPSCWNCSAECRRIRRYSNSPKLSRPQMRHRVRRLPPGRCRTPSARTEKGVEQRIRGRSGPRAGTVVVPIKKSDCVGAKFHKPAVRRWVLHRLTATPSSERRDRNWGPDSHLGSSL